MLLRKHRVGGFAFLVVAATAVLVVSGRPDPNRAEAAGQKGGDGSTRSTAEAELRKTNVDYAAALAAGSLDAVMAFWAPDADYIDEAGKQTQGSERIAALFQKSLPEMKGSKVNVRVHSLKFLRPDICLEDGTVEKTAPTGVRDSNRFAIVWTRTGDKWLISSVRDLPSDTADLPSVAASYLNDLGWLVGEWVDDSPKADVTVKVAWATNKAFLLMDYVIKRPDADPLEVSVRVGWDARHGRIRSWVFDSTGGFAEAYWRKDGKRWIVGTTGILPDGGTGGATNVYEFVDENTFVWRSTERDVDGQPLPDAEVKFVRKAEKK
ncbi:MAG: SgcJ/EcaC family oxidoreductase [Zavarzinella sp.]|nr:SgcJ/EcaC family oxidoreductase [Zavarzinella sp.]